LENKKRSERYLNLNQLAINALQHRSNHHTTQLIVDLISTSYEECFLKVDIQSISKVYLCG